MDDPEAHLLHLEDGRGARRGARGGDHQRVVQGPGLGRVHDRGDDGRRAVEVGDPVLVDERPDRVAADLAQADVGAADRGDRPGRAPAVAVEHRQRPQVDARRVVVRVHDLAQRVQVRAAVVVLHALGAPGGAARVVDADRRALVVDLPRQVVALVATGQQVVPRRAVDRRARVRALRVDEGDDLPDRLQRVGDRVDGGAQGRVDHQDRGPGVVEDVAHLLARQARVHRDEHRPAQRHPEVRDEHLRHVRQQARDAVAGPDAARAQPARQALGVAGELGVGVARRPVDDRDLVRVDRGRPAQERERRERGDPGLRRVHPGIIAQSSCDGPGPCP